MKFILQPWQLMLIILAGWVLRQQQEVIDYLRTENAVLKEKLSKKRILLTDDQRRRLAVSARYNKSAKGLKESERNRFPNGIRKPCDVSIEHARVRTTRECLMGSSEHCLRAAGELEFTVLSVLDRRV
jgi:hypothetical protein